MNTKTILSLLALLAAMPSMAQITGDGYYRVQNVNTGRYISVCDNKAAVDAVASDVELGALLTFKNWDRVSTDPGTVIYVKGVAGEANTYDFYCQGIDTYQLTRGVHLKLTTYDGGVSYTATGSYKGITKSLYDTSNNEDNEGFVTTVKNNNIRWTFTPVSHLTDNFLGVKPEVTLNDGTAYASLYTSIPFVPAEGMKVYYVTKIDAEAGAVVYKELTGEVPAATPVFMKLAGTTASDNRLTLLTNSVGSVSGNYLDAVYFDINDDYHGHVNKVNYLTKTMRMLGKMDDGSLGFITKRGVYAIPHNSCYITVPETAPKELKLVTEEEYAAILKALNWEKTEVVTITANNFTRQYGDENPEFTFTTEGATLRGVPEITTTATLTSAPGTYPITVTVGTVENEAPTFVEGTLTITQAPLLIKVLDATREEGQENPIFELEYTGFKNNETAENLDKQPVVECAANASTPAGRYPIVVSGAESANYNIRYEEGVLTIDKPSGIATIVANEGPADVYNIAGVLVRRNANNLRALPKGVYVMKGRKFIVH